MGDAIIKKIRADFELTHVGSMVLVEARNPIVKLRKDSCTANGVYDLKNPAALIDSACSLGHNEGNYKSKGRGSAVEEQTDRKFYEHGTGCFVFISTSSEERAFSGTLSPRHSVLLVQVSMTS